MKDIFSKLPSIVWVFLIPLGIAAFIGTIIFGFYLLAEVEGVASIIMLVAGFLTLRAASTVSIPEIKDKAKQSSSFALAAGISFFALMGMAIDQPGNVIYNKPMEIFFCPAETHLFRNVSVSHPLPGRTDITQGFYCVDETDEIVYEMDMFQVIVVRFVEYVFIGYALIGINKLLNQYAFNQRRKQSPTSPQTGPITK